MVSASSKQMTVDSTPPSQSPPSITAAIRPFISSITCCAVVGDGLPERLAEGAAIGHPEAKISALAAGWDGMRTATVLRPPVVSSGTTLLFFTMRVIGPGQKLSERSFAASGIPLASGPISVQSAMCRIRGLSEGRPFAS